MDLRVLKNVSKTGLKQNFRGREVWFGPKQSQTFDLDDEEEKALFNFWQERFGYFVDGCILVDVTKLYPKLIEKRKEELLSKQLEANPLLIKLNEALKETRKLIQ